MAALPATGPPRYRAIVALDIERSTSRPNPVKGELRNKTYELFEVALGTAGIDKRHRDRFIDRGDGLLALIHLVDRAPKALVLNRVIPFLSRLLAEYNAGLSRPSQPERQLRIRVVMHAGEVHYDANGVSVRPWMSHSDCSTRLESKGRSGRGPIRWYWWSPGISTARSCAMATTASIVRPFTSSCGSSWRASGTWAGSRCPNKSRGTTWLKWLATGVPPGLVTRVRTARRTLINCRHRGL
jgi:hypothetical protein